MDMLPRFIAVSVLEALNEATVRRVKDWLYDSRFEGMLCRKDTIWGQPLACGVGTSCVAEATSPSSEFGVCCPRGKTACRGRCYDPCPPNTTRNLTDCLVCCPECQVYGQTQDPSTCICTCPAGEIPCNGRCCNPLNDTLCCGGCPGESCDPFTQVCCGGHCTTLGTDTDCRWCGDQVPDGWRCCPDNKPTQLGTTANCGDCGDVCTGGRTCVFGVCHCPSGTRECPGGASRACCPNGRECCANGACCPTNTKCCNGVCVNTNADVNNCGGCNIQCPRGAACNNGVCQCPLIAGLLASGVRQIVCGAAPGVCLDNFTVPAGTPWVPWRAVHPGEPVFTCPGGTIQCNTQAGIVTNVAGSCCPPGAPQLISGVCCPPGATQVISGVCCGPGATRVINGRCQ
jgi:hypothetical protein